MGDDWKSVRRKQAIRQAEGYLELDMPTQALAVLEKHGTFDKGTGYAEYLWGEALRALERYTEAIEHLSDAAKLLPKEIGVWIALGWCFKRTDALSKAIEVLEEAKRVANDSALVNYNLACYLSLAHKPGQALKYLKTALRLDPAYGKLVDAESDFDPLRTDPRFLRLMTESLHQEDDGEEP